MGTSVYNDKCQHCDGQAQYEESTQTGEAWAKCDHCGWQFEAVLKTGANGETLRGLGGKWRYAVTDNKAKQKTVDCIFCDGQAVCGPFVRGRAMATCEKCKQDFGVGDPDQWIPKNKKEYLEKLGEELDSTTHLHYYAVGCPQDFEGEESPVLPENVVKAMEVLMSEIAETLKDWEAF